MIEVCLLQKDFSCAFLCLRLCDLCSWNDSDGMEDYRHWRDWLAGCRDQQGAPFMIMGRMIGCFIMIAKAWVSDFSSVGFDVISLIEFPCWRWDLGWFPAYCWLGFTVWFPSSWLLRGNGIWYIVEISQSCYMCICIYIYMAGGSLGVIIIHYIIDVMHLSNPLNCLPFAAPFHLIETVANIWWLTSKQICLAMVKRTVDVGSQNTRKEAVLREEGPPYTPRKLQSFLLPSCDDPELSHAATLRRHFEFLKSLVLMLWLSDFRPCELWGKAA